MKKFFQIVAWMIVGGGIVFWWLHTTPSDKVIALKETSKTPIFKTLAADSNDAQLFLKEEGQWSAALAYFQKATVENPDDADAWLAVGHCYDKLGRHQEAIESYKQAIRINPGKAYTRLERWQDAIEAYKQAIRLKPDDAEAHHMLGLVYTRLERWQDAIEAFKQVIRIKPDDAEAHFGLGPAPYYAEAHYNLGVAYLRTGDKGSALEEYKILKTLDAEQANELFNLIYQ